MNIHLLQRVKRRATKLLSSLKDENYKDRLGLRHLPTLEMKRLHVFKNFKGCVNVDAHKLFESSTAPIRGHNLKLV